ncbi:MULTISPECIES: shikimate kinase [unclassified Spirosoma]|uniref:shikimate kinase n=1 Tax=unclassified Spirosoma TaxID=2621999 RepID=UPI00095A4C2B|nr:MULTISPECIES: shikimate kinase [unclassified Spirosoma]MBN8826110.1 shikimate kinase [Spirosoma sp.]OJW74594.1 MAG: shikimate kinase [Spirosoma sp. 48-14]
MKNIFLIGMPSSGKSTLGKRIADALHYRFVDTDKVIVREEGRSIADIFAQSGEAYFREVERRVLRTIQPGSSKVVSTGGGMPCFHDNMAYINATGISIFLDVPIAILVNRIMAHAQEDRPLNNPSNPELPLILQKRYETRYPIYSQANIIITGETTEEEVLRRLGEWL